MEQSGRGNWRLAITMRPKRRTILHYIKKHIFRFMLLIISAIILSLLGLAPIPLLGKLTDLLSTNQAVDITFLGIVVELDIWSCFLLIGLTILLNSVGLNYFGRSVSKFGNAIIYEIRNDALGWILQDSLKNNNSDKEGEYITRFITDVKSVTRILTGPMNGFLISILKFFWSVGILLKWDAKIGILSLIVVPPLYYLSLWISRENKVLTQESRKQESKLTQILTDLLYNSKIISIFSSLEHEADRIDPDLDNQKRIDNKLIHRYSVYWLLVYILNTAGLLMVLFLVIQGIISGKFSPGNLVTAFLLVKNIYDPIILISRYITEITSASVSLSRVFELEPTGVE